LAVQISVEFFLPKNELQSQGFRSTSSYSRQRLYCSPHD